jgi:hypothetical protein
MSALCQKQTKCIAAKTTLFDHLGAVMLTARSLGYRAHSIMSCIKLRRASVSKGLRNIGKLGGAACAASL